MLVRQTKTPGIAFLAPEIDYAEPRILQIAGQAGYATVIGFDVDPRDYNDPGVSAIERIVGRGSRPGSIVQLHLGHPQTVQALPGIVATLRSRGLEPTTVSDLLAS